jgi:3-methyl-2-oxobutanoate hydroxymethyltransferase
MKKLTIPDLVEKSAKGEALTMITAYDATFARLADEAGIDMILVGDSLGMVVQGHDTTLPVELDHVLYHCACVARGVTRAVVIADLPFMSYQASSSQALLSAGRALKEGNAAAVKLEGGMEMVDTVGLMVAAGIPVMAHIGLKPQNINVMGGYRIQGKTASEAGGLVDEAKAFERAGAFSLLIEGVAMETAREITDAVSIPTVGISSGPCCKGQVLVIYDMLGLNPSFRPKFLKVYADGHGLVVDAIKTYIDDVRTMKFPTRDHGFSRK